MSTLISERSQQEFGGTLESEIDFESRLLKIKFRHGIVPTDLHMPTITSFWQEVRRVLEELTNDPTWALRYASEIRDFNLPFVMSARQRLCVIDPMSPYRRPTIQLFNDGSLQLNIIPSILRYAKSKEDFLAVHARDQQRNKDAKQFTGLSKALAGQPLSVSEEMNREVMPSSNQNNIFTMR